MMCEAVAPIQTVPDYLCYGIPISSPLPLFDAPANSQISREGRDEVLWLRQVSEACNLEQLPSKQRFRNSHGREILLHSDRKPTEHSTPTRWLFEVKNVAHFEWRSAEPGIFYCPLREATDERLGFWFLHILLPLYLAMEENQHFLHAASVQLEASAVLFAGPSGCGKSTLAAFLVERGHALLADDKVNVTLPDTPARAPLDGASQSSAAPVAYASHPMHRPFREMETLGVSAARYLGQASPLGAIVLPERNDDMSAPALTEIHGYEKFMAVWPHYLFDFGHRRKERLEWLGALLDSTPVYRLIRPWGHEHLPSICDHLKATLFEAKIANISVSTR